MRGISRVVLARDLSAAIAAADRAACKGQGSWWTAQEDAHAAAQTSRQASTASAAAMAVCERCPELARCAELAAVDQYTGLAAGAAYVNGRRKHPSAVPSRPVPPHLLEQAG